MTKRSVLTFDYALLDDAVLIDVLGVGQITEALRFDQILLRTTKGTVWIELDQNTDELICSLGDGDAPNAAAPIALFEPHIGQDLGWSWDAKNDRGYYDLFLFGFLGPSPQYGLIGEGGSIAVLIVSYA